MGNWKTWKIAKIAMAALAVVSLTATVAASTAGAQEEPAAADQPALGHQSSYFTLAPTSERPVPVQDSGRESSVRAAWIFSSCRHKGVSDRPHISHNKDGVRVISVHAWWVALNDDCPDMADVWVALEAWSCTLWSNGRLTNCHWEEMSRSRPERVYPDGGSGNWVNTRHACDPTRRVSWRAVVDVDIPGQIDGSEKFYKRRALACYPTI